MTLASRTNYLLVYNFPLMIFAALQLSSFSRLPDFASEIFVSLIHLLLPQQNFPRFPFSPKIKPI